MKQHAVSSRIGETLINATSNQPDEGQTAAVKPSSTRRFLSSSSNFTLLVLVAFDLIGMLLIFNMNHLLISGEFADNLLFTWKLVIILGFSFLYFYLMDLYTFESSLSQWGMLERSFIAVLLTGFSVALTVYLIGPSYIGGFVGRGVLVTSLLMIWLYSLGIRYLLNNWFLEQRRQVEWIVMSDGNIDAFLKHYRSHYHFERLVILSQPEESEGVRTTLTSSTEFLELAGDWSGLETITNTRQIAGIIVVAPESMPESLVERLMTIRIGGMRVFTLSDFYEKYLARIPVLHLNPRWLATAHGFELIHNPIGLRFKRYIDILIALTVGFLVLPLIGITIIAIYITMGRPILFRQLRIGENGRPFKVNKFRSMRNDAEKDGAQFSVPGDTRITKLGALLRQFRLDELPQIWNVMIGEMSFIGPRPERPEFIANLEKDVPYYNLRHIIRPGITGWAQVMYGYGDCAEDSMEKLQYDLYYIKNYSLLLDVSILVRSVKVVLFGAGR
jgi:exopolysaccharide biosynthesis polyprenyl glycosylphosphotransferase